MVPCLVFHNICLVCLAHLRQHHIPPVRGDQVGQPDPPPHVRHQRGPGGAAPWRGGLQSAEVKPRPRHDPGVHRAAGHDRSCPELQQQELPGGGRSWPGETRQTEPEAGEAEQHLRPQG